jgi:hypothetical protein
VAAEYQGRATLLRSQNTDHDLELIALGAEAPAPRMDASGTI